MPHSAPSIAPIAALLAPAVALIVWSLLILVWLGFARLAAFRASGLDVGELPPGGRGQDMEGMVPPRASWISHNYAHLMEQPTLFYATILILALLGQSSTSNVSLAWAYVVLRIAHSLWQARINTIPVRFTLFMLSTLALLALAIDALKVALSL